MTWSIYEWPRWARILFLCSLPVSAALYAVIFVAFLIVLMVAMVIGSIFLFITGIWDGKNYMDGQP